ncbi:CRISPR-associated endoribonuclease Cas6 [Desulfohalotomaculum tongense]|uniref:CRISPR system precrRNA processing endoribonuclease RAMP protein Cas6 n=1 Tax=Desulforadius tongensis TaxID=1216062 RepID=UPI0019586AC1|nr:CRISPR-associated endoribonuclease Cas6 [Desulforadius tongensis]
MRGLGGAELHGMLFGMLKKLDAGAAVRLHEGVDKPFALEPPQGQWDRQGAFSLCRAGEQYSFSISCLNEEMVELVGRLAQAWSGRTVRLGTGVFTGTKAVEEHPGGVSYRNILDKPALSRDFTLEFYTPTSFRQKGTQILFPLPERVFGSLLHRWNAFSPLQLFDGVDFSAVRVKKYALHTSMVHFEKYMIAGFMGRCTYILPAKYAEYMALQVHALTRFAGFASVGYKVTMGLGCTKPVIK